MNPNLTRVGAAVLSGLKVFVISGCVTVGSLFASGIPISTPHIMVLAVVIAFLTGGIKGLEKAYNYQA